MGGQACERRDNKAKADQVTSLYRARISKRIGQLATRLYLDGLRLRNGQPASIAMDGGKIGAVNLDM
ncbi:hypothetical protein BLNAU_5209 [Blattamonas nauphoetae]|uniref:Uncharacterized protein n=1 Tax=Blattamonas nauphoetae TaxID=2049346 RepID=A0ABQ9Y7P2_9EUKA|nr:hypothetical protein BLNAU_5209 [Blattamonas nauphoetae]